MGVEAVECIVVGAGVVGLAVARALAQAGREVVILERADAFGTETSSRNSEVIHAGIYYAAGSLMARCCVEGRVRLYDYARSHGVAFADCGKLIVATSAAENGMLPAIAARAAANGVELQQLSAADARALEPALACTGALLSPATGIIDSHGFMLALLGDAEAAGAMLALNSPAQRAEVTDRGIVVSAGGAEPIQLACRTLINAAGLGAPAFARAIDAMPAAMVPAPHYAKGNYFALSGRSPFQRLIYPVPVKGGLGTHLTLDLAGNARFGPDVEWVEGIDYEVDPDRAASFYPAIRRYYPDLRDGSLSPAYSGIRPKIVPPAVGNQDFVIQGPRDHGVPGLVNLFGIESPGLTSALALADLVRDVAVRG